jgi:para-nitrobenzyl esterase
VVTINYRLGPFGWFILPSGGQPDQTPRNAIDASGNWGTLDTIAALQWVHDNIQAFGGNARNVTVFGQSAGATNTLALLISPLSEGLFNRVIIQSLGFGLAPMESMSHDMDDPQPGLEYSSSEILLKLLQHEGRAADRAQAKAVVASLSSEQIADFLRGIDPWTLYTTYHPSTLATPKFPTVFQDGAVIRQGELSELLADPKRHTPVPAIVGTNRDEAKMFMAFDPNLVVTVAGLPVWIRDGSVYDRQSNYRALLWKANGVDQLAAALTAGSSATYAYRWDWHDEGRHYGIIDASRLVGASHGLEIPFIFGNFSVGSVSTLLFNRDNESARLQLSQAMMTYWGNFAHSGDPNQGAHAPPQAWPTWQTAEQAPALLIFDTETQGGIRVSHERASKEQVLALMEAQEPNDLSACRMFISTFRDRFNEWADRVWPVFKNGLCSTQIGPIRPTPP